MERERCPCAMPTPCIKDFFVYSFFEDGPFLDSFPFIGLLSTKQLKSLAASKNRTRIFGAEIQDADHYTTTTAQNNKGLYSISWCIATTSQCIIKIGSRKKNRRITHSLVYELNQRPMSSENWATILSEWAEVRPGIRTRLAQAESHCSTACTTTAALTATTTVNS